MSALTAEQVREAIFNGSSYASYDGAKYYADGINMQAIADELNTRAERTCHLFKRASFGFRDGVEFGIWECSECGYDIDPKNDWNYCPNCGARVIKSDQYL